MAHPFLRTRHKFSCNISIMLFFLYAPSLVSLDASETS